MSSCQLSNEAKKKLDLEINDSDKFRNIFNIEIYQAYVRSCEVLITKKTLSRANKKSCQLALKNKNPKLKEVRKFFKENFFFDKKQKIYDYGIMTGYYEPEIKAYKFKKQNTYPIYKMDIKK